MRKCKKHDAGFKARVALEAVKGERAVSELAAEYGVPPTMIHNWKKALLDGAADIFECGGGKAVVEVDGKTVRSLHAKIGELAVAYDFFVTKPQAVDRKVRCGMIERGIPRCRSERSAACCRSRARRSIKSRRARILKMREEIKKQTIRKRRLQHQATAA